MKFINRISGILAAIPYRLIAHWELALASVFGLVVSLSLILSIPLYADAVYYRALKKTITDDSEFGVKYRPPFSFLFHYYGGWSGNLKWEDIQSVDAYLTDSITGTLALPQLQRVRFVSTDSYPILPMEDFTYTVGEKVIRGSLGTMSGLRDRIRIVEGQFPSSENSSADEPLEVLISQAMAAENGFKVGDVYQFVASEGWFRQSDVLGRVPIKIAGIWEPVNPEDSYWISAPDYYQNILFISEGAFAGSVDQTIPNAIFSAYWYFVMDGSQVYSGDVQPLLQRINALDRSATAALPSIRLRISPVEALSTYQRSANLLTVLLYAFSVPIIGLILAFISLVSRFSVERQRNEIAVMRSRGASPFLVLSFTIFEGLLVGSSALLLSLPMATLLTRWIGHTRSFMDFSLTSDLRVGISRDILYIGLAGVLLMLVAILIPAIGAAGHTIVSYKRTLGKTSTKPWWQRAWLDALILIPAFYGYRTLQQQGHIVVFGSDGSADPFQNPLLFLVPALGIFALTLFSLRFIQPIMAVIARIAGLTKNASLTLAARQLSRSPGNYYTPLIILILTVSLSAYTASLAYTFDNHLYHATYYRLGADMRLLDVGDSRQLVAANPEDSWHFLPVAEYRKVEGVESAARLGSYTARASFGDTRVEGVFYGVDRLDFAKVVFWRDDFAAESLGGLMNRLATDRAGVLVPNSLIRENGLNIGDPISLRVYTFGRSNTIQLNVVGSFEYFPTWYPPDGPLFVGNLSYFFKRIHADYPYRVLLSVKDGVDPVSIGRNRLPGLAPGSQYANWDTPALEIASTQAQPERQGLFGFLFIGFAAAALLSALAFLLYVLFSFRQRFIELGVLRAAGLSMGQMSGYMAWELTFLILLGVCIGTGFGVLASRLFIPFLQIGSRLSALVPPFQVLIAWPAIFQIYGMLVLLFGVTMVILLASLRSMKIFQAIKLGETV
ncbi:MAG TPA: FtsX-like permease family protein [Anaerolineales bacterium]|nr:FtsX-like permease family protein [Anaerolineales bacterium]